MTGASYILSIGRWLAISVLIWSEKALMISTIIFDQLKSMIRSDDYFANLITSIFQIVEKLCNNCEMESSTELNMPSLAEKLLLFSKYSNECYFAHRDTPFSTSVQYVSAIK